jgi:hypothetical protein
MYQDKKKSEKVYVESNCVSRDDCCWDETPEMITEVVAVNITPMMETTSDTVQQAS